MTAHRLYYLITITVFIAYFLFLPIILQPFIAPFLIISLIIIIMVLCSPPNSWSIAVIVFMAVVVIRAFLPADFRILGFITIDNIAVAFLIGTALLDRTVKVTEFRKLDVQKRLAYYFAILLFLLFQRFLELKAVLFPDLVYWDTIVGLQTIFKRTIRDALILLAVYFILVKSYDRKTYQALEVGILLGVAISVMSALLTPKLLQIGFIPSIKEVRFVGFLKEVRYVGFLGMDANQAAMFYNLVYAFCLARLEVVTKRRVLYYTSIVFAFLGIIVTASKTGIIVTAALSMLFFFRNVASFRRGIIPALIFFAIFWVNYERYGQTLEKRIEMQLSGKSDTLRSRMSYWELYRIDILEKPYNLVIGNLSRPPYHRSPHNYYLTILFFGGMPFFLPNAIIIYRLIRNRKTFSNIYSFSVLYPLSGLLLSWITTPSSFSIWFPIILSMSSGIPSQTIDATLRSWDLNNSKSIL